MVALEEKSEDPQSNYRFHHVAAMNVYTKHVTLSKLPQTNNIFGNFGAAILLLISRHRRQHKYICNKLLSPGWAVILIYSITFTNVHLGGPDHKLEKQA